MTLPKQSDKRTACQRPCQTMTLAELRRGGTCPCFGSIVAHLDLDTLLDPEAAA